MKLNFYDIDSKYTDFLREFENKIPFMEYKGKNKFLCETVLTVNELNYYVPVSSNKTKYLSSFMICDKDKNGNKVVTSSLRFSFMFQCPMKCLKLKDINLETDLKYRSLTQK